MFHHVLVFLRVFEAIAAVWRIYTLEVQVPAALAWGLTIALDLATLALVTIRPISMRLSMRPSHPDDALSQSCALSLSYYCTSITLQRLSAPWIGYD